MKPIDTITKYFPELTNLQKSKFEALGPFYEDWNSKINLVSRKDIDKLFLHHILHSLSIAKYLQFVPDTKLIDIGTGGGFPGIPLAIFFDKAHFFLIDGKAKKIMVVNDAIEKLELSNCKAQALRAEEHKGKYDFVLARAVTRLKPFLDYSFKLISKDQRNAMPNGVITLKGGDLKEEIKEVSKQNYIEQTKISSYFDEEYFDEKHIIYVPG